MATLEEALQQLIALYENGRLEEAERSALALLQKAPNVPILHNVLGAVQMDQNKVTEAVETFRTALALEPNGAPGHNNLGIALHRSGAHDEALTHFETAIALQPAFTDAHKNLGALFADIGRIDDAVAALRAGDPDNTDPDTSALLLECYLRQGNRTAFDIQLQMIKLRQDAINIRASAAATYAAQQYGSNNIYEFCADPLEKISVQACAEDARGLSTASLAKCDQSAADVTGNDLLVQGDPQTSALNSLLRDMVARHREAFQNDESLYFWAWPQTFELAVRRVQRADDGLAHIHRSWMSGFACLGADSEATIDFTMRGYDLPVLSGEPPTKTVELEPGKCVLFPASLPHRVVSVPAAGGLLSIELLPK